MKHILLTLSLVLFSLFSQAGTYDELDRWPWSWGTECPFPWKSVDGAWTVKSLVETGNYHGHRLEVQVQDESSPGVKLLKVVQYDEEGSLVASGEGYSEGKDRVITAYMSPVQPGQKLYKVIVRSYDKKSKQRTNSVKCTKRNRVLAATFCSPKGRKCLMDSNYILE